MKAHTDITSQTVGVLKDPQRFLESQKLTLGNVVMVRVYLGGDPAKDGKVDFGGMTAGYTQFFGTKEQPTKPALRQQGPVVSKTANRLEHFWLCGPCSEDFTLVYSGDRGDRGVQVVAKKTTRMHAVAS